MRSIAVRLASAAILGSLLALQLIGCGEDLATQPTAPVPGPTPVSPVMAIALLNWCYDFQSVSRYEELFTDDFRWACSLSDSSVTNPGWARQDELISARHLFDGGNPDARPALTIRLVLDRPLFSTPDPAAPWDGSGHWHRRIHTRVDLHVLTVVGEKIETAGAATFHLVRGDSALIPADLAARGLGPDSTRWYIRGWDDATVPPPPKRAGHAGEAGSGASPAALRPMTEWSWCMLKSVYR